MKKNKIKCLKYLSIINKTLINYKLILLTRKGTNINKTLIIGIQNIKNNNIENFLIKEALNYHDLNLILEGLINITTLK